MSEKNLAFIGARGAGKSRISRKLGKLTGRTVLSTDTLISYEANGESIPSLVKREGWASFREREYNILKKVSLMNGIIIDCGGGILIEAPRENDPEQKETLSQRKIDILKSSATVIYVKRDIDWLIKKVAGDPSRPDLSDDYRALLLRRLPWYEDAADVILDMLELQTDQVLDMLIERFELKLS
ncbi:MAG: shikimate kinase [Spirochaetia bacterium]|nr:shikimate kinase [Spirochaetia bacterium]